MFTPHTSDVTFDIDMVFSWVDGSDPEFRARRAAQMSEVVVGEGDEAEARIRQIDELKYALRSVNMFAPWVRRIFVATDSVLPSWLAEHPKITIVRATEHFSDPAALPTYNSHAVESQLQNIPSWLSISCTPTTTCFSADRSEPACSSPPAGLRGSSRPRPG